MNTHENSTAVLERSAELNFLRLYSDSKESGCNAGDPGWIPGWGRSPGEGNGYSRQYSCLETFMDRRAWRVHGVAELDTTEQPTLFHVFIRLPFLACTPKALARFPFIDLH